MYLEEISPTIWSRVYQMYAPTYIVYRDVLNMIEEIKKRNRDIDRKFIKELYGNSYVDTAHQDYYQIDMLIEMGGITGYVAWQSMKKHEKARIQAQRILKGMIDLIERYYEKTEKSDNRQIAGSAFDG